MGTGKPEKTADPPPGKNEATVASQDTGINELLRMAKYVLEANHRDITPALKQNIITFHGAAIRDPVSVPSRTAPKKGGTANRTNAKNVRKTA